MQMVNANNRRNTINVKLTKEEIEDIVKAKYITKTQKYRKRASNSGYEIQEAIEKMRYRIETASAIVGNGEDGNAFEDMEMAIEALEKLDRINKVFAIDNTQKHSERNNMNLLEHYIQEVHSIEDITEEYEKIVDRKLEQPVLKVSMTVDCCGNIEKVTKFFLKNEWENSLKQGFYLA